MQRLAKTISAADILIVNATTAPFPPVSRALVPDSWGDMSKGVIPEFDIDFVAAGTASGALTDVFLYAAKLEAGTIADDDFTATHGTETFTATAHGLMTGDGPIRLTNSGGALPAGTAVDTDYYVIRVDADTFKLALTRADAWAGTNILITGNGTGTHTLVGTASTELVRWRKAGTLSASMSLAIRDGYTVRCSHSPRNVAYAVVWTGTAGAAVKASVSPVYAR
jgi:hypothetical protein